MMIDLIRNTSLSRRLGAGLTLLVMHGACGGSDPSQPSAAADQIGGSGSAGTRSVSLPNAGTSAVLPPRAGQTALAGQVSLPMPMVAAGSGGLGAAVGGTAAAAGSLASAGTGAAQGGSGSTAPTGPAGPQDGDPSKPVVAVPEVACKADGGSVLGLGMANLKVDDRDVIIDYPCQKHEGAPVTFILNLHGTAPPNVHFYQEGYFSAFKYVGSNNLIIATPSAVSQQWGREDMGADQPYLMHVIDWVYKNLGTKFDIRSMWVGGHSWGAFFTAQFGCLPELADKVDGLIIMSGSPTQPACASKMSVIDTNAEMDIGPPLEQGAIPMQHGCKAPTMTMLGNNTQTLWPDCTPGYVHSNYLMLGKMHIDAMDDVVVKSIVDLISQARP